MWVIFSFERKSGWRKFGFGALLGLIVAEGGSIWYRPETYVIFVAALSSAGSGIYVLDLGLREHDALYLVAIYQAFLILIGSVSGGMNTRWQLVVYSFIIVTTVGGIIVLSDKHTQHCNPGILSARIIGAKQGERNITTHHLSKREGEAWSEMWLC
ncbi:hypothetical protein PsorP6_010116 [Peronosclerospora sorghi]|uniref:Uncharacterized protein n=1 Tax=Peronosclerospora sorghi TaxID=230839 RepID=A0ACC0VWK4_9STRA|nr:hypothetical protein PsorP6_010116 [Peronosclerospora sorghi]